MKVPFGIIILSLVHSIHGLTLPKMFHNGMVLQGAPTNAIIWGFLDGNSEQQVTMDRICDGYERKSFTYEPKQDDATFEFSFMMEQNEICNFVISQGLEDINLNDVHFGDVWICSGQSNMEFTMGGIFNSSEEIAKMAEYPNIRLFRINHATASEPQDDFNGNAVINWVSTTDVNNVKRFSAVCLLTIKNMADVLGKDKTFGLIETSWGGTRIEPWSTPEGLDDCYIEPNIDENNPQRSNSYLYNAMIHPFIRTSIYGALWYQGEANTGWNRDEYGCTFPSMISEWRRVWSENSGTNPQFPFGFVQLSTVKANDHGIAYPMLRWHQTSERGRVPNDILKDVFMAVAIDTYDEQNGIHPRNKQLPSQRLATAGLNIAYGREEFPTNGPYPVTIDHGSVSGGIQVDITYDQPFVWNPVESEGFYVCTEMDYGTCLVNGGWEKVPSGNVVANSQALSILVDSRATAIAYLWETTPVLGMEALPMYADNKYKLPGAPWWQILLC